MEKISVAVRFRPPTSPADPTPADRQWRFDDTRISLPRPLGTPISSASFAFDHVFDHTATNAAIYDVLIRSIIRAAVDGFNGTAFAYGQTSSGKTFTMNGSELDPGIIPLAIRDVFDTAHKAADREFLIRVSYMEIYNEEINDLLTLGSQKLPIHESLERGVYVAGLREEIVNSAEQVLELLKLGEANRHFGETNMNVRSSRSHTIFRMVIESSAKDQIDSGDAIRVSVLNLVDLAGSERIAKTGAGGVRLKEGKHINKSLMILGNVINKLSENTKQRGHIPYRDSKLTRILQPALGGNAKTSIICTAAPEEVHIEETRGTLQFASRAKRVTNCAQVNEILTDAALLKRQNLEIEDLRKKLQGSHSEVLEQVILKQRNDMHKSELEREKLAMELEEERKSRKALEQCLLEQQKKIEDLSNLTRSADQSTGSPQPKASPRGISEEAKLVQQDAFRTPNSKQTSYDFVAKRSNYRNDLDFSPIPENLGSIADEDLWAQLNKGCITDLDMLELTPGFKCPSSLPEDATSVARCQRLEDDCNFDRQQLEALKERCAILEKECNLLREQKSSLEKAGNVRCQRLEDDCNFDRQQLEASKEQCATLEKKCNLLREQKSSLIEDLSMANHQVELLTAEKEKLLKELNMEKHKMKDLKEEIRLFGQAFSRREGLLTSLYTKSKAMVENLKVSQVALPEIYDC